MDRNKLYYPMLARKADAIFDDPKWLFEPKIDGIRCIAYIDHDVVRLINRSMIDITDRFPEIAINLAVLHSAVIDGELCVFDKCIPNFQMMQTRMNRKTSIAEYSKKFPATFVGFDLLEMNGECICGSPLIERKDFLENFMRTASRSDSYASFPIAGLVERGKDMLASIPGWEGVMAKSIRSKYHPGERSNSWLKIKPKKYLTVQVLGCTAGLGRRANMFGALIVGVNIGERYFTPLGSVGTGLTDETIQILYDKIMVRPTDKKYLPPYEFISHRCEPFPVLVSYIEKTNDGKLRFPVFEGFVEEESK